jgi:hypothetical protein
LLVPEIVDLSGLGGPRGPRNLPEWKGKLTIWKGFQSTGAAQTPKSTMSGTRKTWSRLGLPKTTEQSYKREAAIHGLFRRTSPYTDSALDSTKVSPAQALEDAHAHHEGQLSLQDSDLVEISDSLSCPDFDPDEKESPEPEGLLKPFLKLTGFSPPLRLPQPGHTAV